MYRYRSGFAPAGICYDAVTMMYVATLAIAGGQVYQGQQADKVAKAQASQMERQGEIARQEGEVAATQREEERRRFLAEQRMAYLADGVTLSGTPGIVAEDTFKQFQTEIDAIRRSGVAQYEYYQTGASNTRSSGRTALTSSLFSATGTVASGGYKASSLKTSSGTTSPSGGKTASSALYKD